MAGRHLNRRVPWYEQKLVIQTNKQTRGCGYRVGTGIERDGWFGGQSGAEAATETSSASNGLLP
jgi:hypothetical protein